MFCDNKINNKIYENNFDIEILFVIWEWPFFDGVFRELKEGI